MADETAPVPGGDQSSVDRPAEGVDAPRAQEQSADHQTPVATDRDQTPVVTGLERQGMFRVAGSGDTSGFGGLRLPAHIPAPAERPYGGWFDEFADEFATALRERGVDAAAIQQVTVDRGELIYYLRREDLVAVC